MECERKKDWVTEKEEREREKAIRMTLQTQKQGLWTYFNWNVNMNSGIRRWPFISTSVLEYSLRERALYISHLLFVEAGRCFCIDTVFHISCFCCYGYRTPTSTCKGCGNGNSLQISCMVKGTRSHTQRHASMNIFLTCWLVCPGSLNRPGLQHYQLPLSNAIFFP